MILYFQDCKHLLEKTFQLTLLDAAWVQCKVNVGGVKVRLGGGAFIPVKATIVSITTNHNNCDGITSDKA